MRKILSIALVASMTTACATIDHGAYQRIPVRSEPAGASVGVDCGSAPHHAKTLTPTVVSVPRAPEKCRLLISKDGFESQVVELQHHRARGIGRNFGVAGAGVDVVADAGCCYGDLETAIGVMTIFGGLIIGGIGTGIDAATGAMYERTPGAVAVHLEPLPEEEADSAQ